VVGVVGEVDIAGVDVDWVITLAVGIGVGAGGMSGVGAGASIWVKPRLPPTFESPDILLPPIPFSFSSSTMIGAVQACCMAPA